MAYYHHLLQNTKPPFESPAKVFALLKSKVKKEGTFTVNDSSCDVTDNHGAVVMSPRKKGAQSSWRTDKENHRSASHQASELSPQKTFRYPDISSKHVEEMPPPPVPAHGYYTPRKRAFLESTALSHLSSPISRPHIHTETPHIRDSGGFKVISSTPVKTQPVENDFVSGVFEEGCAPQDKQVSHVLSPMRKRLKKSTWEMQEFNTVSSSTKEVNSESTGQPQEKKTSSAFTEDNIICMDSHLGNVRGFPAYPSGMTFTHEPVFPSPRPTAMQRCHAALDRLPLRSPAKVFAYMKERESKTKQQEVHKVSHSTKDLFDEGNFHQSIDTPPPSTAHNMGEMEDIACRSVVPVNRSRVESAESSQSDTYPSEDVPSPAVSPQPVLLEDSLILNTPRISIPKKEEAAFKRKKWPTSTKFPYESTIYLRKWFLRKNNRGLFVDGIHRDDNIPWNSNIIVERVSNSVVKTVSGSVYILVGKMNMTDSELPKWLLKMFAHGFPRDWKALYERLLSRQETDKGRSLEASSMVCSVKQHKKKPLKTPNSCPPASLSRANVSRSGRLIKPPLEYWRGGRVILDAQMNVTIHECYDTSIYTPVTTKTSQKPARVFLPCSEGRKQSESASNEEASAPLRRVKAPLRKQNSAEPEKKPSYSSEPPVEALGSPEERSDRPTRSSRRRPATERALYVDTVPQIQSEPEKSSTRRSKRQAHNTTRHSVRVLATKRAVPASASSSDDGVIGRKKPGKEVHRKRSGRVLNESRPCYVFPSSSKQSESDSDEEASAPLRRVKAPLRKRNSAEPEKKPSYSSEPPVERLSSPEERSDRPKRSSRRRRAAERALHVDTVPQMQSEPEKSSTRRSKRQAHNNTRPSVRVLASKQAVPASASSDDGVIGRKKPGKEVHRKRSGRVLNESRPCYVFPSSESSQSSDELEKELGKRTRIKQTRQSKCIKSSSSSSPTKRLPKSTRSSKKKPNAAKGNAPIPQEQDADEWTEAELMKLQEAVSYYPNHMAGYWAKVAKMVGTRSAEECHYQHTSKGAFKTPAKRAKKPQKEKVEAPKVQELPVISSRVGTYKRKQQVRQFLEAMPREDVEDVFSSAYMQNKRFEMPSMCPSDHDFTTSEMEPLSPMSTGCAGAKTPQCLHLTPGMMGSPNRNNGDKYVYQLQKRMKKNQFNVCKQAPPSKSFTPTPSVKRTMRRCGNTENDTFFVREMFPGKDGALSDSGEEEDFYFSDND